MGFLTMILVRCYYRSFLAAIDWGFFLYFFFLLVILYSAAGETLHCHCVLPIGTAMTDVSQFLVLLFTLRGSGS